MVRCFSLLSPTEGWGQFLNSTTINKTTERVIFSIFLCSFGRCAQNQARVSSSFLRFSRAFPLPSAMYLFTLLRGGQGEVGSFSRLRYNPTKGVMLRVYSPVRRVGILAVLFPALLLLPTLHLHPAYEHTHETDGAHRHLPVVHVDFLPVSAHGHGEHHRGHGVPGDTAAQPLSQISFSTLLPRGLVFLLPALQRVPVSLPAEVPVISSPFSFHTWLLTRDHSPPVQRVSLPLASPRSPPPRV